MPRGAWNPSPPQFGRRLHSGSRMALIPCPMASGASQPLTALSSRLTLTSASSSGVPMLALPASHKPQRPRCFPQHLPLRHVFSRLSEAVKVSGERNTLGCVVFLCLCLHSSSTQAPAHLSPLSRFPSLLHLRAKISLCLTQNMFSAFFETLTSANVRVCGNCLQSSDGIFPTEVVFFFLPWK